MDEILTEANRPLTPKQVAERWDCSSRVVLDALRANELQGFKVGREWRITPQAVQAYESGTRLGDKEQVLPGVATPAIRPKRTITLH